MIRLSVPFRQALSRLTLPVMLMLSLGIVLFGRADQDLGDHLRAGLDDLLAPAYQVVSGPIEALENGTGAIGNLFNHHGLLVLTLFVVALLFWLLVGPMDRRRRDDRRRRGSGGGRGVRQTL